MDYFSTRRSVRKYKKADTLPQQKLEEILTRAMQAPNTGNMQLYSVVVTRSAEGKAALAPAHFGQPAVEGCEVLLTVCVDVNRFSRWCRLRGATSDGLNNFQAFAYAMIDACIFAQQIVTIAELEGYGTCYMGTTTYNAPQIAEVLHLPAGVIPVATVTVGTPDETPAVSERLPLEGVMHIEKYHDYTDADIERIYAPKEELDVNRRFVEINGKDTLAQVFADIRYTKADNEHFSRVLYDFIRAHGFPMPDEANN